MEDPYLLNKNLIQDVGYLLSWRYEPILYDYANIKWLFFFFSVGFDQIHLVHKTFVLLEIWVM